MKILLVSTNADEAGAPRHVEAIVNGLESNFQFILVFGEDGPISTRLKSRGNIVYLIKEMRSAIRPVKDLVALIKITKLVWEHQPDIIHCHSAKAGMLGRIASFLCGKKWLYTVHGWGWRGVSKVTKKLVVLMERILSKIPRGSFIFVANDVMNDAINILGLEVNQGIVVYNGVSPITTNLPKIINGLVIMMPARVSTAKDHQSLVLAFERFNDEDSKLILCGGGTDSPEFISLAKKLAPRSSKNISFLGQRSDISEIYSQSNVVALISHFEALPLSIIEAMSCAKPVIATNVGGIPELITNGVNGILVRPSCVDDIVEAFTRYRNDQVRIEHGKRAKITYEDRFTDKSMLTSISKIYHSL
jgi:glycosyltransferase involved in cell wall biosynthesis